METDQSYVFFQEAPLGDPALGSTGTLGVNLTPLASLAIDPSIHPLGAPFFVAADGPDPVHGVLIGAGYRRRHQGRGAGRYLLRLRRGGRTPRRRA